MEIRWFDAELGEESVLICCEDEVEEWKQWVRDEFGVEPTVVEDPKPLLN